MTWLRLKMAVAMLRTARRFYIVTDWCKANGQAMVDEETERFRRNCRG